MRFRPLTAFILLVGGLGLAPLHAQADHPGVAFGEGPGAAINTLSATIVPPGSAGLSLRLEYTDLEAFSDEALKRFAANDEHADSLDSLFVTYLNAAFGVTQRLSLSLSMPYVRRNDIRHGGAHGGAAHVHRSGDSVGPGDLSVFGKYQFWRGAQWRAALALGVQAPTGLTSDRTQDGDRFEVKHQPGSGSWDPLIGLAATRMNGPFTFHLEAFYRLATEGSRETTLGNALEYGGAVVYRPGSAPAGHKHKSNGSGNHVHGRWSWVVELNGLWEGRTEEAGEELESTGGHRLLFSPGVRYSLSPRWAIFTSFGVPIWQDRNEHAHETDYRATIGVSAGIP